MANQTNTYNYYSNPAFCQQSEFGKGNTPRQSPLGAQNPIRVLDPSRNPQEEEEGVLEEQEFYEEVVVDDKGFITDKKFVVVAQNNEGKKYIQEKAGGRYGAPAGLEDRRHGARYASTNLEDVRYIGGNQEDARQGPRYATTNPEDARYGPLCVGRKYAVPPQPQTTKLSRSQSQRYEYIQMREQDSWTSTPKKNARCQDDQDLPPPARVHRYAVINPSEEEETELASGRYALVPVEQLNQQPSKKQYVQEVQRNQGRYEYIQTTPQKPQPVLEYPRTPKGANPIATQKLYELLSTPRKSPALQHGPLSPSSTKKLIPPQFSPISKVPKQRTTPPKAQQKLNYALATRGGPAGPIQDKRHTAIVAPICSSPIQSVYSETTFSNHSGSWSNLKGAGKKTAPVQTTLSVAATMMFLCGSVTAGLCFYMIKEMGRVYFLDFGVVSGFTCVILGMLGYRTRNVYWLPNRNYISGYLVLSVFSLLTCTGLLVLLVQRPPPGSPLADMTSGAVCGFSGLSLLLAAAGVVSSYCCRYPPPDNRVQHCAQGFTV